MEYIEPVDEVTYTVKKGFVPNMRVPGIFYVNDRLRELILDELQQHSRTKTSRSEPILDALILAAKRHATPPRAHDPALCLVWLFFGPANQGIKLQRQDKCGQQHACLPAFGFADHQHAFMFDSGGHQRRARGLSACSQAGVPLSDQGIGFSLPAGQGKVA
eukprot:1158910-Pelagomonas_calceolata.AAC.1